VYEPLRLPAIAICGGGLPIRLLILVNKGNQENRLTQPAASNGLYTMLCVRANIFPESLLINNLFT